MNFADRMKDVIQRNLFANNDLSGKFPEEWNEFGNNINLYREIHNLEKKLENKVLQVGNEVYSLLIKREESILCRDTKEIKELLIEIRQLEELIQEKELHLI